VLAAAAYRWGLWETLATAAAEVGLLWIESFILLHLQLAPGGELPWRLLAGLRVNVAEFEPNRLFMLSVYLLVMGLLLGYLAEQQKHLRAEKAMVTGILAKVRVEAGLRGTLEQIFAEVMNVYGASKLLMAAQEAHSHRTFLGQLSNAEGKPSDLVWLESSPQDEKTYLYRFPGDVCYAVLDGDRRSVLALDHDGNQVPVPVTEPLLGLQKIHPFRSLITISFLFGGEWKGRVFLIDPSQQGEKVEELRFLLDVVRQVGPAIYNVYLLHRLRRRAGAMERARFARELHDGAVQSLIAVEMQVDVLKRQATPNGPIGAELGRIQGLLREEVLKLRELMQQMKSIDVDAQRLLAVLIDTVERFQRETGISARFVTDVEDLDMPQRVCRELVRIVQEGLTNARKHAPGQPVALGLGFEAAQVTVTVANPLPPAGAEAPLAATGAGAGLTGLRERAALAGGTLEAGPADGTWQVCLRIPA